MWNCVKLLHFPPWRYSNFIVVDNLDEINSRTWWKHKSLFFRTLYNEYIFILTFIRGGTIESIFAVFTQYHYHSTRKTERTIMKCQWSPWFIWRVLEFGIYRWAAGVVKWIRDFSRIGMPIAYGTPPPLNNSPDKCLQLILLRDLIITKYLSSKKVVQFYF